MKNSEISISKEAKDPNYLKGLHQSKLAGVLIKYGFHDEYLYFDKYGDVQIEWEMSKSVIYGIRKEWDYLTSEISK